MEKLKEKIEAKKKTFNILGKPVEYISVKRLYGYLNEVVTNKTVKKVKEIIPKDKTNVLMNTYLPDVNSPLYGGAKYTTPSGWKFNIWPSPTGCGLGILYGVASLKMQPNLTKKEFIKTIGKNTNGFCNLSYGSIICTLGQNYYNSEEKLFELGFEMVSEYNNKNHGSEYTQRLYILKA